MKINLINDSEMYNIVELFRLAIVEAQYNKRFKIDDRMYNFPNGCCDDASDILAYHLFERYGIQTKQGNGVFRDGNPENTTNHVWLIENGERYIDITAAQFRFCKAFQQDVYVGKKTYFYEKLEDIKIYENYNICNCNRLFEDYKIILEYLL